MKTNIIATLVAVLAVSFGIGAASAQETGGYGPAIRQGNNGTPVIYHHASTLEEGVLRGTADWLRGSGDKNYSDSLAAINIQEARSRAIVNAENSVQTYFDIKAINREARALNQNTRISASDAARLARKRAPKGLTAMEFDTATGRLVWPYALQDAEYDAQRATIDGLVAAHGVEVREVKLLANNLDRMLKEHVRDMPVGDYVAAKRFLSGLQADAAYGPSVASR